MEYSVGMKRHSSVAHRTNYGSQLEIPRLRVYKADKTYSYSTFMQPAIILHTTGKPHRTSHSNSIYYTKTYTLELEALPVSSVQKERPSSCSCRCINGDLAKNFYYSRAATPIKFNYYYYVIIITPRTQKVKLLYYSYCVYCVTLSCMQLAHLS